MVFSLTLERLQQVPQDRVGRNLETVTSHTSHTTSDVMHVSSFLDSGRRIYRRRWLWMRTLAGVKDSTTTTIIIWLQYYTTTNIQIYFFRNSRGAKENGRAQYQNSAPTINLVFLINPPWSTDIPKNPNSKAIYHGSGLPRPMRKLDPPTLCQRLLPPDSGGSDFWQIRWIGRKNPRTSDWWLDASASESRARFCHPGALVVCGDRCIVSRSVNIERKKVIK